MRPVIRTNKMLTPYNRSMIIAASQGLKNIPVRNAITPSLAAHGINELAIIIVVLSLLFLIVLVAITPATLQPKPMIRLRKAEPCIPNFPITLSIR